MSTPTPHALLLAGLHVIAAKLDRDVEISLPDAPISKEMIKAAIEDATGLTCQLYEGLIIVPNEVSDMVQEHLGGRIPLVCRYGTLTQEVVMAPWLRDLYCGTLRQPANAAA